MINAELSRARIGFLGAGNMAEALVKGLVASGGCPVGQIRVSDQRPERVEAMRSGYGVGGASDNLDLVRGTDVVVLAVKPQGVGAVLEEVRDELAPETLLISIAAGIPCARIEQALASGTRVVRVMPNTPSLVGAGAAAIAAGAAAGDAELALAEALLASVGIVVRVAEADLDAVTALSGSGPAYVFLLVEAMLAAAKELGLPADLARKLAVATVEGSARLLDVTGEPADELRRRVTSKGGTTEAALAVMEQGHFTETVRRALHAARDRSRELSSM